MAFKVYLYISLTLCSIKEPDIQTQIRWVFLRCLPSFQSSDFPNKVIFFALTLSAVQLLSCVRLCDPMDCSTPGFPVLHCLLEFAQTLVHWLGNATKVSCSPFSLSVNQLPHGHEEKDDEPHKKTEKVRQGRTAHVLMGSGTSQRSELLQASLPYYPRM